MQQVSADLSVELKQQRDSINLSSSSTDSGNNGKENNGTDSNLNSMASKRKNFSIGNFRKMFSSDLNKKKEFVK